MFNSIDYPVELVINFALIPGMTHVTHNYLIECIQTNKLGCHRNHVISVCMIEGTDKMRYVCTCDDVDEDGNEIASCVDLHVLKR